MNTSLSLRSVSGTSQRLPKRDRIIQSTDVDALSSKYSAYLKGYISKDRDPFVEPLVAQFTAGKGSTTNNAFIAKLPLINRGEWTPEIDDSSEARGAMRSGV
ncbi:hypothetical protein AWJ20_4437 [Sugiyamaella lignohabitans]|uniref:Uncharacterized protein n=1 Tax=Sugiyamaella lignohabitans TaxID=796027 RepID=A0A167CFC9_9ASCO|nr:uncharacterized protein AWJ20_4437 [Sugiyamaella lignohabitans]ANB11616.1 hypothetical protein AWJ20_4437 [Sugiyamaella lignohabitans]